MRFADVSGQHSVLKTLVALGNTHLHKRYCHDLQDLMNVLIFEFMKSIELMPLANGKTNQFLIFWLLSTLLNKLLQKIKTEFLQPKRLIFFTILDHLMVQIGEVQIETQNLLRSS